MEARIVALERNFERVADALGRIEKSQDEARVELRDLRRDLKEKDIPILKEEVREIKGALGKTPTFSQMIAIMVVIFAAAGIFTGANIYLGKPPAAAMTTAPSR